MGEERAGECDRRSVLRGWRLPEPAGADDARPKLEAVRRGQVRVTEHRGAWPARTDRWCWHCCHPFEGPPLPMPIKYEDRGGVFHVTGTFCSWACMKTYNLQSSSYMKHVNANLITLFHKRCTGVLRGIRGAPPRQALRVFGGTMDIAEFRAAADKGLHYVVLPPRMILHHDAVYESTKSSEAAVAKQRRPVPDLGALVTFKDVATKNETLRLKRPRPLKNQRNLLERTMGIGAGKDADDDC